MNDERRSHRTEPGTLNVIVVTAALLLAGMTGLASLVEPVEAGHDTPADQDRLQFAHRPTASDLDARGLYVNPFDATTLPGNRPNVAENSLRVYGQNDQYPPDSYLERSGGVPTDRDPDGPWRPEVIPKDSVTFNPAVIGHNPEIGHIERCGNNADMQHHQRLWYEPKSELLGPRTDLLSHSPGEAVGELDGESAMFDPPTQVDQIVIESTFHVVTPGDFEPASNCEGDDIAFPTQGNFAFIPDDGTSCPCEVNLDTDPAHYQPGLDTMERVVIRDIQGDKDTNSDGNLDELANVSLEASHSLGVGEEVQFMDRVYQFRGLAEDGTGSTVASFRTWYAGNNFLSSGQDITLPIGSQVWLDRHANTFHAPLHDVPKFLRTSYIEAPIAHPSTNEVDIVVGKDLMTADVFYTDGVRYEVALVSVDDPTPIDPDSGDEELTSITLRAVLPKSDPQGAWTSVPDDQIEFNQREAFVGPAGAGSWQVVDASSITTQWLVEYNITDPLPLLPPYNQPEYTQLDNTDVLLWEPAQKPGEFPFGPVNPNNGLPLFPLGADYLTREDPGPCFPPQPAEKARFCDWFRHFGTGATFEDKVDSMRTNNDIVETNRILQASGINDGAWTTWVDHESTALDLYPIKEWCEARYSTSLHEVLEVDPMAEDAFTMLEVNSHPCAYTELVLPSRPNPASFTPGALTTEKPFPTNGDGDTYLEFLLGGDYLVTTSFRLKDEVNPGVETRHAFVYDPRDVDEVTISTPPYLSTTQRDLYVNEITGVGTADSTVRLYGFDPFNIGAGQDIEDFRAPFPYTDPEAPFDPNALPMDSATFNPAIIPHTDPDTIDGVGTFSWIQSCQGDANLKKHVRMWYDKRHNYTGELTEDPDGPGGPQTPAVSPPTTADVLQVESTYRLIDSASLDPVPMCGGTSQLPFPTEGTNAELAATGDCQDEGPLSITEHGQPGLDTLRRVDVARVFDTTTTEGGVDLERSVTLGMGDTVQLFDRLIQFASTGTSSGTSTVSFNTWYAGNADLTQQDCVTVVGDERIYIDPAGNSQAGTQRPADDDTQSVYLEVNFVTTSTVRLTIGKEIHAGDTFYVDGVRYDVPAVRVVDGELDYITLRTPLPKGDPFPAPGVAQGSSPCSDWTTVPEDQIVLHGRMVFVNEQCQVHDPSVFESQYLVAICPGCPIPVDPPFNQAYRQVDDSDVQLWKQAPGNLATNFPFGAKSPDVPGGGDGQPLFPRGEDFLTRQRVDCSTPTSEVDAAFCDWVDHFQVEATGFMELRNRITPTVGGETPINPPELWDGDGLPVLSGPTPSPTPIPDPNLFYRQEWCEPRYNSTLYQLLDPTGTAYETLGINTDPCQYTELVLPERTNPASELLGVELETAVPELPTAPTTVDLLGGDYIITTSLQLEEEGHPAQGSSAPQYDAYDTNQDCTVQTAPELMNAIRDWLRPGSVDPGDPDFNPRKLPTFDNQGPPGPPSLMTTATHWLESPGYC